MANYHDVKMCAIGSKEKTIQLLKSMIRNYNQNLNALVSSDIEVLDINELTKNVYALCTDDNHQFEMNMLDSKTNSLFFGDSSNLDVTHIQEDVYISTFAYSARNHIDAEPFTSMSNQIDILFFGYHIDESEKKGKYIIIADGNAIDGFQLEKELVNAEKYYSERKKCALSKYDETIDDPKEFFEKIKKKAEELIEIYYIEDEERNNKKIIKEINGIYLFDDGTADFCLPFPRKPRIWGKEKDLYGALDCIKKETDIIDITNMVMLKKDGTVKLTKLFGNAGKKEVESWTNIEKVWGHNHLGIVATIAIDNQGKVFSTLNKHDLTSWRDVVKVDSNGGTIIVGLKKDGTCEVSDISAKKCAAKNIEHWKDVVDFRVAEISRDISAIGICGDGSIFLGENRSTFLIEKGLKPVRFKATRLEFEMEDGSIYYWDYSKNCKEISDTREYTRITEHLVWDENHKLKLLNGDMAYNYEKAMFEILKDDETIESIKEYERCFYVKNRDALTIYVETDIFRNSFQPFVLNNVRGIYTDKFNVLIVMFQDGTCFIDGGSYFLFDGRIDFDNINELTKYELGISVVDKRGRASFLFDSELNYPNVICNWQPLLTMIPDATSSWIPKGGKLPAALRTRDNIFQLTKDQDGDEKKDIYNYLINSSSEMKIVLRELEKTLKENKSCNR